MTTDESPPAERFSLSRWSRRKHEVARAERSSSPAPGTPAATPGAVVAPPAAAAENAPAAAPLPPVDSLTFDSDFAPFVQPKVDESTKRAALKKLFADPQFNLMDGLDIYIDDYGKPDPLPEGMLRQLAQSQFLGLFDDDEKKSGATAPPLAPTLEAPPDEDADLRLQSHDAADAAEPGAGEPGAGEDAAGER